MALGTTEARGAESASSPVRWTVEDVLDLYALPFNDLLFRAQEVHRRHFDPNAVQISTLLSVKTGGCPENCSYCSQSAHHQTGLAASKLMDLESIRTAATQARDAGASRFCMGAAWRELKDRDMPAVAAMISEVKALGMETCVTLGMVEPDQARQLKEAGLDYYNHNIDTSPDYYDQVVTTRTFQERLDTLDTLRDAGIKLCCGGILGLGETRRDRAAMVATLANLPEPPESVPINELVPIPGTPAADKAAIDPFEFVRTIAAARIAMPASVVRLSAGRESMSDEMQALCFLAGANSIFLGETLLTVPNAGAEADHALFARLGLKPMEPEARGRNMAGLRPGH